MKRKLAELDVDIIGRQDPVTKEEEKLIIEFIKTQKMLSDKKQIQSTKAAPQRKINA